MPLMMRRCSFGALIAGVPVIASLGGCKTYRPHPLDLTAHRETWSARSPQAEGVADFARRLAESEGSPGAFDPTDGLSLAEGEVIALFFNPALRVARLKANVARASADNAGLWDDPEFGFDGARILADVDKPWIAGATVGLTIPISGRLAAESARASAEHRSALERVAVEEWTTRTRLRDAWFTWSAQALRVEQTRQFLSRLDEVVAVADRLEQAGEMARPEARLFRVERITRQNDSRLLEARARESELAVKALLGFTPEAPAQLLPQVSRPLAPVEDRRAALERRNPTLVALRSEYEVAERTLRREVREQYPDITVGPGFGEEDGDPRVLLSVSLPIPLWNRNRRGVAEADAQREVARAEFETGYESLISRLAAAEVQTQALTAQRQELESVIVPLVDEQFADVRRIAEAGDFNALLTLETLVRQHETKLRLIDARLEEARAMILLEQLIGPVEPADDARKRIELLGCRACSMTPRMRERLLEALAQLQVGVAVEDINLEHLAPSDVRRGFPTPTVLVNGRDLFDLPPSKSSEMRCRVYAAADRVPSTSELAAALERAITADSTPPAGTISEESQR